MTQDAAVSVKALVAYAHVADLERSIAFYRQLGFSLAGDWESEGRRVWAHLRSGDAQLMIAQASAPVVPDQQAVLFYCYADDVKRLRQQLQSAGIACGDVTYPDYMSEGEIRTVDPDGYVVLVGQPPAATAAKAPS